MPAVRFPASAIPLLPLCKGHGEHFIFRTYADLLGFLAAFGFHSVSESGVRLTNCREFVSNPNPIGIEVFENRGLLPNFLLIALAYDESRAIAEDDELLTKFIEKLVDYGAVQLSRLGEIDSANFRLALIPKLLNQADSTIIKI